MSFGSKSDAQRDLSSWWQPWTRVGNGINKDVEWAPSGNTKKFFARNSEDRVFKEYYGFEFKKPNGYDADISWIYYDDLNLYSKNVHNHIDYDIKTGNWIVIVEI